MTAPSPDHPLVQIRGLKKHFDQTTTSIRSSAR